jgi:hypothetical protein
MMQYHEIRKGKMERQAMTCGLLLGDWAERSGSLNLGFHLGTLPGERPVYERGSTSIE